MAKKTFVVTHGSLYLAVGGKLQQVDKGTEITLDEEAAKSLLNQKKIISKADIKKVKVDDAPKDSEKS